MLPFSPFFRAITRWLDKSMLVWKNHAEKLLLNCYNIWFGTHHCQQLKQLLHRHTFWIILLKCVRSPQRKISNMEQTVVLIDVQMAFILGRQIKIDLCIYGRTVYGKDFAAYIFKIIMLRARECCALVRETKVTFRIRIYHSFALRVYIINWQNVCTCMPGMKIDVSNFCDTWF